MQAASPKRNSSPVRRAKTATTKTVVNPDGSKKTITTTTVTSTQRFTTTMLDQREKDQL